MSLNVQTTVSQVSFVDFPEMFSEPNRILTDVLCYQFTKIKLMILIFTPVFNKKSSFLTNGFQLPYANAVLILIIWSDI